MPTPHHILVVGCGSIGERHLRTFLATGRATVAGCDPNPAVRERIATTYRITVSDNWLQAIAADWTWHAAPVADRDSLYIAQAAAFLDACEGRPTVTCSLEEGLRSIRFNLATFRAWQSGQAVTP